MSNNLWCKLVGDRDYISQPFFEQLYERSLQLITPLRKNMKNLLVVLDDKLRTRKRAVIETIIDQLENILQILHTRHRSTIRFAVNLIARLIAYTWQVKMPSLHLSDKDLAFLPALT